MLVLCPIQARTLGSHTKLQSFKMFAVTYFTFYSFNACRTGFEEHYFWPLSFSCGLWFWKLFITPSSVSRKPTILHHYLGKDWQSLHLGTGALGKGSPWRSSKISIQCLHISLDLFSHMRKEVWVEICCHFLRDQLPRCCTSVVCSQCLKANIVDAADFVELRAWPKKDIEGNTCCSIAWWRPHEAEKLNAMPWCLRCLAAYPLSLSCFPKQRASVKLFGIFCMLSHPSNVAHQSRYDDRPIDWWTIGPQ